MHGQVSGIRTCMYILALWFLVKNLVRAGGCDHSTSEQRYIAIGINMKVRIGALFTDNTYSSPCPSRKSSNISTASIATAESLRSTVNADILKEDVKMVTQKFKAATCVLDAIAANRLCTAGRDTGGRALNANANCGINISDGDIS